MLPTDARLCDAAVAAHRFGLGEPQLAPLAADPRGWLLAQLGPADTPRGDALPGAAEVLQSLRATPAERRNELTRGLIEADRQSRLRTALATRRPFAERLHLFWCNHFTVSIAKGAARALVGAFEREAIRPHIAGSFEQLLAAATTHPAMLRYLDNQQSAGPNSRAVERAARRAAASGEEARVTGLNENLARELLELHTLGGGHSQADVTACAALLTGWRAEPRHDGALPFDPAWHEPGAKTVLGRRYGAGPEALPALLHDLAVHPSTAQHVCTKLARHVVADDPPPALVERLAARWRASGGQLDAVCRVLVESPEAWDPTPAKLKTPEEFVLASARLLELDAGAAPAPLARLIDAGGVMLGQRAQAAPSPAGWPDRAADWMGPEALWKRVEWAHRFAARLGRQVDARELAAASLGPQLDDVTRREIERAADAPQALALLLLAPQFQRR